MDSTNNFIQTIFSNGFSPLISIATRVNINSATLIDNIITNVHHKILSEVLVTDISDHFRFLLKSGKFLKMIQSFTVTIVDLIYNDLLMMLKALNLLNFLTKKRQSFYLKMAQQR